MVIKKASAVWHGGLKDGHGHINTESGVLEDAHYGFTTRFEGQKGTNPEELIGAAHAGCFSMAFANELGKAGHTPDEISTEAAVTLDTKDGGFTVTKSALTVTARVPDAPEDAVRAAAETAKTHCPISKLLKAEITMELTIA